MWPTLQLVQAVCWSCRISAAAVVMREGGREGDSLTQSPQRQGQGVRSQSDSKKMDNNLISDLLNYSTANEIIFCCFFFLFFFGSVQLISLVMRPLPSWAVLLFIFMSVQLFATILQTFARIFSLSKLCKKNKIK